ncbi:MAG: trypsin-like peptidase domain-containing protein [Planctomycetota bacterium]
MRHVYSGIVASLLAIVTVSPCLAGGFDVAIDSATHRAVKLYGLGAGAQAGYGTGTMVSSQGHVLTVDSLLIDAKRVRVVLPDGTRHEAEVLYRDFSRQLALLQVRRPTSKSLVEQFALEPLGPFPFFDMKDGFAHATKDLHSSANAERLNELRQGDWVLAAGNAFKVAEGPEMVSVAHGVFSTRTRLDARRRARDFPYQGDVLVIDAITSNPGAAGGPVVDIHGRLIGIIGREVISNLTHTHFNYAVPLDVLQAFYADAMKFKEPTSPEELVSTVKTFEKSSSATAAALQDVDFGFRVTRAGYTTVLPFVEKVRLGSSAARGGLKEDDLILTVNGKNVADVIECEKRIADSPPGKPLDLVVRRDRAILPIRVESKQP